ncbi:EAL domain-containing protein [Sulfurimonas sediminis]|uniref:EAL domain-containing protein n=1 Tax=Sulfurimonas sediminis TaxID=2590020 RepID=A0A7M1B1U3_9BACT|nr:EAL domain-containing protein [Sulfurimonas sediminis]QOP43729.1 EAL domain-containing protein [Sulfurimonas sediminis]
MNIVKNKWTIFYVIMISSAVVFAAFTYTKYTELQSIVRKKNEQDTANVAKMFHDFLVQSETMLQVVGTTVVNPHISKDPKEKTKIFDTLQEVNPAVIGFGYLDPQGNLLISNKELHGKKINALEIKEAKSSFQETLKSQHLVIGRSFFFKPLGQWILPLRKAIRDKNGKVVGVMAIAIINTQKKNLFSGFETEPDEDILLIKKFSEGYYRLFYSNKKDNHDAQILYGESCPKNRCTSVINQILVMNHITLQELKSSAKVFSFFSKDMQGRPINGALYYDKKYKVWISVYHYNSAITQEIYKDIVLLVMLYIIMMLLFYFLFKSIEKYENAKERDLLFKTTHDLLTNLPNRAFIYENVYHSNKFVMQKGAQVIFIDLDNFKNINDTFGHIFGDKILVLVAKRLQAFFTEKDLVARQGGDEFIIINNSQNKNLQELIEVITMPYIIEDIEVRLGASVGVSVYPDDASDFDTLLSLADIAMYEAKKVKNSYAFFTKEMQEKNSANITIEQELRSALQKNEIYMVYQPQINADGTLHGVEALVRWKNEKLGFVSPADFIPVAEATGLILELGNYITNRLLLEIKKIYAEVGKTFQLSVNVSIVQLMENHFLKNLLEMIHKVQFDTSLLTLEVTERLPIEDLDYVLPILKSIRAEGMLLSLDDFGTGYSSLSVLTKLPINELKIDKAFVDELLYSNKDKNLVKTIINIGKNFSMDILAEGTESKEQVDKLKEYGCDIFQGYYYSKPLKKEDLIAFIRSLQC